MFMLLDPLWIHLDLVFHILSLLCTYQIDEKLHFYLLYKLYVMNHFIQKGIIAYN